MINTAQNIIISLTQDSTLAGLMNTTVPNNSVYTGDVYVVREKQNTFQYPLLTMSPVSEEFEVMPLNGRQATYQLDIFSRNSEIEAIQIYEQVVFNLSFINTSQDSTKIWWTRPVSATNISESEMRIFHIRVDIHVWSFNNSLPET